MKLFAVRVRKEVVEEAVVYVEAPDKFLAFDALERQYGRAWESADVARKFKVYSSISAHEKDVLEVNDIRGAKVDIQA